MDLKAIAAAALLALPRVHADQDRADQLGAAIADVVADEDEHAVFQGPHARERTALLLESVIYWESGFRSNVEACTHEPGQMRPKGDHGLSVGLPQLMRGPNWEGHTEEEICGDARLQVRLELHLLARSRRWCGSLELALGAYNSGACVATPTSERVLSTYIEMERKHRHLWAE